MERKMKMARIDEGRGVGRKRGERGEKSQVIREGERDGEGGR